MADEPHARELALAQAHLKLPQATKRSVLIMATTAEESGLLGASVPIDELADGRLPTVAPAAAP